MYKASCLGTSGVRVNIIIWDEIDSGDDFLAYTRVSKMLHGGGATGYFKDTEVSVKLMPRKSHAPQVTAAFSTEQICHSSASDLFALIRELDFAQPACFWLESCATTSACCTAVYSKRAFQNAYILS